MTSIDLKARAKINLSLDVIGKRPDGYHDVKMIMQTIAIHDQITVEIIPEGIEVLCDCRWVPSGEGNIAYKAAQLLLNQYGIKSGVRIKIDKRIPVAAGLAGGSSDAAAVLKGIRELFSLKIDERELMSLGKQIGADVPYCIKGGTMLSEGIGELLTPLSPLPKVDIVLVKPKIGLSTAWVYKNLNLAEVVERPDTGLLIKAIEDKGLKLLAENMKNVLESVSEKKYMVIKEIKDRLVAHGALGSMMSGSGPSVFGIFGDDSAARKAFEAMKSSQWECFLTETINGEM